MEEEICVKIKIGMLLCLRAPLRDINKSMEWVICKAHRIETKPRKMGGTGNITSCYVLRFEWVCQYGFSAVVQVHPQTIQRNAAEVSEENTFTLQKKLRCKGQKGKMSFQTTLQLAFLRLFAKLHALPSPAGLGSHE